MLFFWLFIIRILKIDRFRYRDLTEGEVSICKSVFGDLIDYDAVKIMNHPYLPWQPVNVFMAPDGYIHAREENFSLDYSKENRAYQAVFIHEMAHVYQHQQKINVLLKGAFLQTAYYLSCFRYDPYAYQLTPNKPFAQYNIEQQGDIAKDIFLQKIENIILDKN